MGTRDTFAFNKETVESSFFIRYSLFGSTKIQGEPAWRSCRPGEGYVVSISPATKLNTQSRFDELF